MTDHRPTVSYHSAIIRATATTITTVATVSQPLYRTTCVFEYRRRSVPLVRRQWVGAAAARTAASTAAGQRREMDVVGPRRGGLRLESSPIQVRVVHEVRAGADLGRAQRHR